MSLPGDAGALPVQDEWTPLPTLDAREGGDSVWEAWHEESRRMDLAFAQTQPSGAVPLETSRPPTPQAQSLGPRRGIDDAVALARRNNRACPRPLLWSALYVMQEGDRHADLAPPPVQSRVWPTLSNLQRRLRFREHIEWAARHGKLDEMARYMESFSEQDWVHMDED